MSNLLPLVADCSVDQVVDDSYMASVLVDNSKDTRSLALADEHENCKVFGMELTVTHGNYEDCTHQLMRRKTLDYWTEIKEVYVTRMTRNEHLETTNWEMECVECRQHQTDESHREVMHHHRHQIVSHCHHCSDILSFSVCFAFSTVTVLLSFLISFTLFLGGLWNCLAPESVTIVSNYTPCTSSPITNKFTIMSREAAMGYGQSKST